MSSTSESRYRQFYQAGAELIGAQWREAADAEILAVALDALEAAGAKETSVEIGDVDIRNAFIDNLPISERSKTRIRRIALSSQQDTRAMSTLAAQAAAKTEASEYGELASLLASVEPRKAELLIREVFALADVRHVGGRTPEEIVERLMSRTAQQVEPISAELMQGVIELLKIRAKPALAFAAIREHFRKFGIASIEPVLERCENRLRYFNAYRQSPVALEFNVGLQRNLEFYTAFLFDIFAKNFRQIGLICGGGRYDNLLEGLGASAPIPAVGFGIGVDRLLLALQNMQAPRSGKAPSPQALVIAPEPARYEEGIGASVALRGAEWSVELDSSGRDERSALAYAAKHKIPYVVIVGEDKAKKGQVRVRRMGDRADQIMTLSSLEAYANAESARGLSDTKT